MKKFSEVKQGDTVYFLIDTCGILQEGGSYGHSSMGFANSNYGLIICSRIVTSDKWEWHNPRTDNGLLFTLYVDNSIIHKDECLFGPHTNEYGHNANSGISIVKKEGEKSCLRSGFGDFFHYSGYVFTTKEELEAKVREVTDVVEDNLRKINEALAKL